MDFYAFMMQNNILLFIPSEYLRPASLYERATSKGVCP